MQTMHQVWKLSPETKMMALDPNQESEDRRMDITNDAKLQNKETSIEKR